MTCDRVSWTHHASGQVTTSFVFLFLSSKLAGPWVGEEESVGWINLWKSPAGPRVLFFLWQFFHYRILPAVVLFSFGSTQSPMCLRCGEDIEIIAHLFFSCSFAQEVWFLVSGGRERLASFDDCWNLFATSPKARLQEWKCWVVYTLWWLWKDRNTVVFERQRNSPMELSRLISWQVREFPLVNKPRLVSLPSPLYSVLVSPTAFSASILQTDASFALGRAGLGGACFRSLGNPPVWVWKGCKHAAMVVEAELLAIAGGLGEARRRGLTSVIVESDSLMAIGYVNGRLAWSRELEGILKPIWWISSQLLSTCFVSIP
ncbi:hypothetical protein Droror1_Dr00016286 [Drosera rotundifolia]